jgi:hypothetical protein
MRVPEQMRRTLESEMHVETWGFPRLYPRFDFLESCGNINPVQKVCEKNVEDGETCTKNEKARAGDAGAGLLDQEGDSVQP